MLIAIALALIGDTAAVHLEEAVGLGREDALEIGARLARAIERATASGVGVDRAGTACAEALGCLSDIRARNQVRDVVLLRVIRGVTKVHLVAERRGPSSELVAKGEVDLGRGGASEESSLDALARSLYPEGPRASPSAGGVHLGGPAPPAAGVEDALDPPIVPYVLAGAGAVLVGAAAGFLASSAGARSDLTSGENAGDAFLDLTGRMRAHQTVSEVLIGAGVTSLCAAVLVTLLGDERPRK